ncbi:helix-turn-helix transcriptional regulator [Cronobacter malonaticus]|uniref:helix-turn-helix transcriptional regulator n=2 Tax=Cronobacter malonaticus TaxID=413503 RepID=UPI0009B90848|nr:AraC family transcriptional regulator [Cronobacter malonaticus]
MASRIQKNTAVRYGNDMNTFQIETIRDITQWINENLSLPFSATFIAQKSGYSQFYFQRMFSCYHSMSLSKYILHARMNYALKLLHQTDLTICHISLECGFSTQQTFTRVFSKYFQMPPSKWREKHRKSSANRLPDQDQISFIHIEDDK